MGVCTLLCPATAPRTPPDFFDPAEIVPWIAETRDPAKRASYARVWETEIFPNFGAYTAGPPPFKRPVLMQKADEVLPPDKKFRSIANVGPTATIMLCPPITHFQNAMKRLWAIDNTQYVESSGPYTFHPTWGSGRSNYELGEWARVCDEMLTAGARCIACGDDVVLFCRFSDGSSLVAECDYSMYDQSQSGRYDPAGTSIPRKYTGPLFRAFAYMDLMEYFVGTPNLEVAIRTLLMMDWELSIGAGIMLEEWKLKFEDPATGVRYPILPTGFAGTGCFNTINTISAFQYWFVDSFARVDSFPGDKRMVLADTIVAAMDFLGLKVKVSIHSDITTATFLKGMFCPATITHKNVGPVFDSTFIWSKLPGQLVKFGWCKRAPADVYSRAVRRYIYQSAERQFLADIAESWKHEVLNPVTEEMMHVFRLPFHARFLNWCRLGHSSLVDLGDPYKPKASTDFIVHTVDFSQMWERYGASPDEVNELVSLIRRLRPGVFLRGTLVTRLLQDYFDEEGHELDNT